jgi:hypothetical protein
VLVRAGLNGGGYPVYHGGVAQEVLPEALARAVLGRGTVHARHCSDNHEYL